MNQPKVVCNERGDVRVIPVGRFPYRIFYTVSMDDVVILHVRHAARLRS
jgi:hypothetical protein